MKTVYGLVLSLCMLITGCTLPDDGPIFDYQEFRVADLITVEADNLQVDDILWIDIAHPSVLTSDTETVDLIGLQQFESVAPSYTYFQFLKVSGFENPLEVTLNPEEVVSASGEIQLSGSTITTMNQYDDTSGQYASRFGIMLKEPGTFQLRGNAFSNDVEIYVDGLNETVVRIFTNIQGDEAGVFTFTVE